MTTTIRTEKIYLTAVDAFLARQGWTYTAARYLSDNPDAGKVIDVPIGDDGESAIVAKVNDLLVFGVPGVYLTPEGAVLGESTIYPSASIKIPRGKVPAKLVFEPSNKRPGEYLFLDGIYSEFYWHWMMEYLPRAVIAESADFRGQYVVRKKSPSFVIESLNLIGVDSSRILERDAEIWQVECAWVPEIITGTPGHGRNDLSRYPSLILDLRDRMLVAAQANVRGNRRLYISRQNATRGRRIVNHDAVSALVEEFGFEVVQFEKMTLAEQIQLVYKSEALVGPHGAGMLQALFLPAQSAVLEIFPPNFITDTNATALGLLKHRYQTLAGVQREDLLKGEPNLADIEVDIDALRVKLEELLS